LFFRSPPPVAATFHSIARKPSADAVGVAGFVVVSNLLSVLDIAVVLAFVI